MSKKSQRPEGSAPPPFGELVVYQTEDGRTRVECRFRELTPQATNRKFRIVQAEGQESSIQALEQATKQLPKRKKNE